MPRIAYYSDLHLEASNIVLDPGDSDLVAIVGDVMAPQIGQRLDGPDDEHEGVWWLRDRFPDRPVLFVPGNHDYEGTYPLNALAAMRRTAEGSNVIVLWNEAVTLNGVRYIGSPLFSDPTQNRADPQDIMEAVALTTDIKRSLGEDGKPLSVEWIIREHYRAREFIAKELSQNPHLPKVVLTHWAPSPQSQNEERRSEDTSGYWATDCEDLVAQANVWLHGHIHDTTHYRVGNDPERGQVLNNPRGFSRTFGLATNLAFDPGGAIFEVPSRPSVHPRFK